MQDIESDYWKDIFRHLQHRNMSRIEAARLTMGEAPDAVNAFSKKHPEVVFTSENTGSYITFETFITETVKIRLFIQNQIKGSLMQSNGGDWVKIADAKFPNNPFPEVELLLENRARYAEELKVMVKDASSTNIKQKITLELIKALCMEKFGGKNIFWEADVTGSGYKLTAGEGSSRKEIELTEKDFVKKIEDL